MAQTASLRIEVFPRDLARGLDFYTRVLGFAVTVDRRAEGEAYVALRRGTVHVGAVEQPDAPDPSETPRRPPTGVELVLEVEDVVAERDRVVAAGWPLEEDLQPRHWGLTDFRVLDPDGYYWRITHR